MQNKFGLKDFILLVLVLGVGVSIWLGIFQEDRRWEEVRSLGNRLTSLERTLMRLEGQLEEGIVAAPAPATSAQPAGAKGSEPPVAAGSPDRTRSAAGSNRDDSWAVPGVQIKWQEPYSFTTDPRQHESFAVGGTFAETFNAQPPKVMPYLAQDVYSRYITDIVFESLAEYDPETLQLRGVLADAWQEDPEGLWVRARINARARFSDGRPVTAEDVRFTYEDFVFNPELETERSRSIVDNLDRVEVISERVVEFHFKEPMFSNLSTALGAYVLPKHFYEQLTSSQINQATSLMLGSGPYMLEELDVDNQWRPGRHLVLIRNEQYWGPRPPLERMRFNAISDGLARLTSYNNGETSMITPDSPQFNQMREREGWDERNYSLNWINMRSGVSFIAWQCGERNGRLTPFHDVRVRQAMTHLLDRERMISDVWDGIGLVAFGRSNPTSPAAHPTLKPLPYNLQKAKELLAEAGWTDRTGNGILNNARGDEFVFEFTIAASGEVSRRLAAFVRDSAAAAGIRCEIKMVDWSIYSDILSTRNFDALVMGWGASAPESDPRQIWHSSSIQNQGDNFIQWASPRADALIDEGRRTMDFEKRMAVWHQLDEVIHEEQPYTWLRVAPWLRFIKKDFENVIPYPKGLEYREFFLPQDKQNIN